MEPEKKRDFLNSVSFEVNRANSLYGDFHSLHEAYAVLLEEVDELWEQVRKKEEDRSPGRIVEEAIQIAAVALRIALSTPIQR